MTTANTNALSPESLYLATRDLSVTEVAALIRSDIKAAVRAGVLPAAKYSVTSSRSGGQSIRVSADGLPFCAWEPGERGYGCDNWHPVLTTEAKAVRATLKAIHGAYNYDRSDSQRDYFDVRYYGDATIDEVEEYEAIRALCEMMNRGEIDAAAR